MSASASPWTSRLAFSKSKISFELINQYKSHGLSSLVLSDHRFFSSFFGPIFIPAGVFCDQVLHGLNATEDVLVLTPQAIGYHRGPYIFLHLGLPRYSDEETMSKRLYMTSLTWLSCAICCHSQAVKSISIIIIFSWL